jgi:ribose transport system substrate-binding protein
MRKALRILALTLVFALLLTPSAFAAGSKKKGKVIIGYSNSLYGNIWREKMVEDSMEVFKYYKGKGMVDKVIVTHSGMEVNTQIQQIRNMISQGVDVILINPSSVSGLTGVIEEAGDAGIPVIVFDGELPDKDKDIAYNVVTDKIAEGYKSGKWVAEQIGGRGKVVIMLGFAGVSGTEQRRVGVEKAFAEYPGIEVLTTVYGQWNQATAEAVMNDVVAAHPRIDAFWAAGSMAMGCLRGFMNAGRPLPVCAGDPTKEFFVFAKKKLDQGVDFKFCCPGNPPGIGGTALALGIYMANGYKLKKPFPKNTYYYPVRTFVTADNLDEFLELMKDDPETMWCSEYAPDSQIRALFK